jgi:hypothetical protein
VRAVVGQSLRGGLPVTDERRLCVTVRYVDQVRRGTPEDGTPIAVTPWTRPNGSSPAAVRAEPGGAFLQEGQEVLSAFGGLLSTLRLDATHIWAVANDLQPALPDLVAIPVVAAQVRGAAAPKLDWEDSEPGRFSAEMNGNERSSSPSPRGARLLRIDFTVDSASRCRRPPPQRRPSPNAAPLARHRRLPASLAAAGLMYKIGASRPLADLRTSLSRERMG